MKANDIQCELLQYNSIITEVILTIVLPSLYVFNNNYSVISWWSVLLVKGYSGKNTVIPQPLTNSISYKDLSVLTLLNEGMSGPITPCKKL